MFRSVFVHVGAGVVVAGLAVAGGASSEPSAASSGASPPLGEPKSGIATYYSANGTGNCSFEKVDAPLVVALNKERHWAGSAVCGGCLRVTGAKGEVIVRVVDSCPVGYEAGDCGDSGADLDLSKEAFAKIDDIVKGKINVTYELVRCDVAGPLQYRFKEGSSQYWTAIQVRNHRIPIVKLEYRRGADWVDMPREDYNYFVAKSGVGDQPAGIALRVTAQDGTVQEDKIAAVKEATVVSGTARFE